MKTFEDVKRAARLYRELETADSQLATVSLPAKMEDVTTVILNDVCVLSEGAAGMFVCREIRTALIDYWTAARMSLRDELRQMGCEP